MELRVTTAGSPDTPPVVLLHAFPVHGGMWATQVAGIADMAHVIVPDQRGFGGSPLGSDPPSLDLVADDVVACLDRIGIGRAVVGGLSMGGYVVMNLLRRYPDRVGAVILADTRMAADPEAARANRERVARTVLEDGNVRLLLDEALPTLVGATTLASRPRVLEAVRTMVAAASPAAVAWAQRAMAARPDSTATLASCRVPALVVSGDEDVLSPPAVLAEIAGTLPDARLVTVPRAGHLTALEAPEVVTAAIRSFLLDL